MRHIFTLISIFCLTNVVSAQCPVIAPIGHDTCRFDAGSTDVRASGSPTGLYSWYDSSVGGSFLGSSTIYTTPFLATTTSYFVASAKENKGLTFDGDNDYVAIDNFSYSGGGIPEVTVEVWVKTTNGGNQMISSFDRSEFWRLSINGTAAGTGQIGWNIMTDAGQLDMGSTGRVDDGEWHHIACVYDNGLSSIYIDGVLDAQQTLGTTFGTANTRFGFLSGGSEASTFNGTNSPFWPLLGEMDDFRIWNVAKTVGEIQASRFLCLDGTEPNLDVLYDFEGTTSTVIDLVNNADGTMFNMDVPTDRIDVVRDFSCPTCESSRTEVVVNINTGSSLDLGAGGILSCGVTNQTIDAGAGFVNYNWSTGESSQTINISSAGEYSVIVDDGASCFGFDTINIGESAGSASTALHFDGGNDRASIAGFSYNTAGIPEVTVEAWIKTTVSGNQIITSFDRNEYWRFGINGNGAGAGQVSWCVRTNAGQLDFGSVSRVDDGAWHHVVGVYDNGLASIYIDGALDNQTTLGTTFGLGNTRFGFVSSGSEASTENGTRGPTDEFNGDIDELRIWSVAKTETEIRDLMCRTFTGGLTGLEVYYIFNDGTGSSTITDVANGNNATLRAMSVANDWITSGAAVGDNSIYVYPGSWGGEVLTLTSCSGDEIEVSNVNGALDGAHLYVVESDPSEQTDILAFTSGNHYYGVFQTNTGTETYDVKYTYTNHPLLTVSNEESLYLLDRLDNAETPWVDNSSTNDIATDELTVNVSGRKEIIIDSKEFVWTGATSTDWNTAGNWLPTIVPPVSADIRIPNVVNQPVLDMNREIGYLVIEPSATVDLNSFELSLTKNFTMDGTIISNGGTLDFQGVDRPQSLFLANPLDIDNIIIDNPMDVTTESGSINLVNTLTVSQGSFETNNTFTILSTATSTGRIAEITGTGITGEIIMERHINAGETYWRFFSSAVQGATIGDYEDDFITSGYLGSAFPNFGWTSIYNYDETQAAGLGYVPVSSTAQLMNPGEGFMVWSGDTITGTQPFTVDLNGVPNQGNVIMPISFTSTGSIEEDGWNLVGNPYASTIDWDSPNWLRNDMANAIQILNPDTQQYATYVNGASTLGGSRFIASQQAFWVYANSLGSSLTATEGIKATVDQAFFKSGTISPGVNISVNGFGMRDECIIRHAEGALDAFDSEYDAYKIYASSGPYPNISLLNTTNEDFTVHSFDQQYQEFEIPMRVIVYQNGFYDINFENLSEFDVPCMKLEDTYSGQFYDVEEGQSMNFELSDTTYLPRFILHIGRQYEINTSAVSCNDGNNGEVSIELEENTTIDYTLSSSNSMTNGVANGNPLLLTGLEAGTYVIDVPSLENTCDNTSFTAVVSNPSPISVLSTINNETNGNDGSIDINVNGGVAPYSFDWNNGIETQNLSELTEGSYYLIVTDANGCTFEDEFVIGTSLNINEQNNEHLTIMFNSNSNEINFYGLALNNDENAKIYNVEGKEIAEFIVPKSNTEFNYIIKNELSAGVYVIKIKGESLKFVKD